MRLRQLQGDHVSGDFAEVCIGRLTQALQSAEEVAKGLLEHVAVQRTLVVVISHTS